MCPKTISPIKSIPIEDRLGFIVESIVKLERLSHIEETDFISDDRPAIAESYLRRSLEAMFDIGRHILAKTAGKAVVEYKQIALTLGHKGVITKEFSERLMLMAGYRNRLVHFYHAVTDKELYQILKINLSDIKNFVKEIKTFIEKYRAEQSNNLD